MLKRSDVPKVIYIRDSGDVVRQLSSIGTKTYSSSHKSPYGDAARAKTLTDNEYKELWANLRKENMDMQSPVSKGALAFVEELEAASKPEKAVELKA